LREAVANELILKDYLDLSRLHSEIVSSAWKFEDESGDRILASLRVEFVDNLFLCLFVWGFKDSIALECTEGIYVRSLFYAKFKKKTKLSVIKSMAADLVLDLITGKSVDIRAVAKAHKAVVLDRP
jgi:hypothetical protein